MNAIGTTLREENTKVLYSDKEFSRTKYKVDLDHLIDSHCEYGQRFQFMTDFQSWLS